MSKTAGILRNSFIREKAFLAETRQKECLSVAVMAEFAVLFCTARQPAQYDASAAESLAGAMEGLIGAVESRKRAVESLAGAMERLTPCSGKLVFTFTTPHV